MIYQFTTVRISYFCGSYQFRENGFDHYLDDKDFSHTKKWVETTLRDAKKLRKNENENYWASFSIWDSESNQWVETEKMFKHRIQI